MERIMPIMPIETVQSYISTRNAGLKVCGAGAVTNGIAPDGGLFVPETLPKLPPEFIIALGKLPYHERAYEILRLFFPELDAENQLRTACEASYMRFDTPGVTGLRKMGDGAFVLELWHGPTCAFKDMALQILPRLLTMSAKYLHVNSEIAILTATSGDTGKAALEGFRDVPGTKIMVFYPESGVSAMQKRQMITQEGGNVCVAAVKGNFDDCQTGVKSIFGDGELSRDLEYNGIQFSSANSINWGRLAPQIVYYVSSYVDLLQQGEITFGEKINICVPTGNFGNILAAYYAKEMGIPINRLICASNKNNVLTDFIQTGVYNRRREFFTTDSPSMDILISSNLERLLFELSGKDDAQVRSWFADLGTSGQYTVSERVRSALAGIMNAGYADDQTARAEIRRLQYEQNYLIDTHTAVAVAVYRDYVNKSGDKTPTVIASTANPFKFAGAVYEAVSGEAALPDDYQTAFALEAFTGQKMPPALLETRDKTVRFSESYAISAMEEAVRGFLL
jgi:threonine synthase